MLDYRHYRVPGGTYFFTTNLLERRADLLVRHIEPLRKAVKCTRADRPFHIDAWVMLPDRMHCVITLPPGDEDFLNRIKAVARVRSPASVDDNVVACHSSEHPCGASALRGLKMMYAYFQKHGLLASADEVKTLEALLGHAPRTFDAFVAKWSRLAPDRRG